MNPDDFRKINGLVRWSTGDKGNGFSVTASVYQGAGTPPTRSRSAPSESGLIDRFDAIDPTDGGETHRYSLSGE